MPRDWSIPEQDFEQTERRRWARRSWSTAVWMGLGFGLAPLVMRLFVGHTGVVEVAVDAGVAFVIATLTFKLLPGRVRGSATRR